MSSLAKIQIPLLPTAVCVAVVSAISFYLRNYTWKDYGKLQDSQIIPLTKDWKKDVVYVYGMGKVKGVYPSPFTHKLLAFLDLTGIPYVLVKGNHMGKNPRNKLPMVELQGQVVTDSGRIISVLSNYFNKHVDSDLTKEEQAISLAIIRLLEEHYYWTTVYYRWKQPAGWNYFSKKLGLPAFIQFLIGNKIRKSVVDELVGQGLGRHSDETVVEFARDDLQACADLLGEHEFFFGKSTPHMIDVVLYSALATQDLGGDHPHFALLSQFPSLLAHKKNMEKLIPINSPEKL